MGKCAWVRCMSVYERRRVFTSVYKRLRGNFECFCGGGLSTEEEEWSFRCDALGRGPAG